MTVENRKKIGSTWMATRTYKRGKALTFGQTTRAWVNTVVAVAVVIVSLVLVTFYSNQETGWSYLKLLVGVIVLTWAAVMGLKPSVVLGLENIVVINPFRISRIATHDVDSVTRGKVSVKGGWHWVVVINTKAGGHVKVLRLCSTKASHLDPIVAALRGAIHSEATFKARHGLAQSGSPPAAVEGPLSGG